MSEGPMSQNTALSLQRQLGELSARIQRLEDLVATQEAQAGEWENRLPKSNIISDSLIKRSFACGGTRCSPRSW